MTAADPSGLVRPGTRVLRGPAPDGLWTLDQLAGSDHAAYADRLRAGFPDLTPRSASVTLLHYALHAIGNVVLAPLVFDDVVVEADAPQVGVVVDDDADVSAFWLGHAAITRPVDRVGEAVSLAMRLVEPVRRRVGVVAGVGSRALLNVTLDSLYGSCEWLERVALHADRHVTRAFLAAAGHPGHDLGRVLPVQVDGGAPVELRVPATCCVLSTTATCHSCPTCPRHPNDEARRSLARAWLGGLDGQGFLEAVGRPRVSGSLPGGG